LYAHKTATKHAKTGLISGYAKLPDKDSYKYIAPWIYTDTCDTLLFNTWLECVFIPEIKLLQIEYPNNPVTLIMDNVSYHKSEDTKKLCKENRINLKFQPPYSPDLNPIEPSWNTTKNEIRNLTHTNLSFEDRLCHSLTKRCYYG
jgi:DDE superfamily endonuclease